MKSKLTRTQVVEAFSDDPKLTIAADRLGCSVSTAHRARIRFDIATSRSVGRPASKAPTHSVRSAFSLGGTLEQIGSRLGVTRQRAHQLRVRYGFDKRKTELDKLRVKVMAEYGDWIDVLSPVGMCCLLGLTKRYDQQMMEAIIKTRGALCVRARRQAMCRMYRDGWGEAEIAQTFGVWKCVVERALVC